MTTIMNNLSIMILRLLIIFVHMCLINYKCDQNYLSFYEIIKSLQSVQEVLEVY
jgi:hypothetical protein